MVCVLPAAPFCKQTRTMSTHKQPSGNVLLPAPMHHKNLWCRKEHILGGVDWMKVSRDKPSTKAKKPCTASSQQPACTHKEHQILSTAEATAFAT